MARLTSVAAVLHLPAACAEAAAEASQEEACAAAEVSPAEVCVAVEYSLAVAECEAAEEDSPEAEAEGDNVESVKFRV